MAATPEAPIRTTEPPTTASPIDEYVAPVEDQRTPEGYTRDGRAVTALVLGIIAIPAMYLFGLLAAAIPIVAIVLGAVTRSDMRRTGRAGQGQATAGMVLGVIALCLFVVVTAVTIVVTAGS